MDFEKGKIVYLAAGIFSGFGTALCISRLREFIREKCTRKPLSRMEDNIRLEDLEVLVRSPNFSLRKSAEQVLLDRAMKKPNLEFIIKACYSQDEFQALKAVVVLAMMVKGSEHTDREMLLEHGILESLSHCLVHSADSGYGKLVQMGGYDFRLQRYASESLFHLIYDEDEAKIRLARSNSSIIRILLRLISETPNKEVMRWCLFSVHQLAACDSLRPDLVANGVTPVVSEILVRNQGDLVLMRTCLHTLVMFVNNNTEDEVELLKEMAKHGVIRTAVVSLRTDDSDLVYWSAGLLHQFAVQDVHKGEICSMPNIVKSFQTVLCSSEALLQRLVLRVLSFLCVGNQAFRSSVLQCSSLVARFPTCLASGDSDIVHWAVVLLHDLLLSEGTSTSNRVAAERVVTVNNGIIKSLVPLAFRKDNILIRLVAEVLGLFCSIESLQSKVIEDSVLKAVLAFSVYEDSDLQFWASALLLNMAMTSDEVKKEIIKLGGLKPLMELAINDSGHPQCAAQAAKTLVMLGFLDVNVPVVIKSYGYKNGDYVSISIESKEHCPNKPGVNVVVMDFLTFQVTDMMSFDTGHDVLASEYLVEFIEMVPVGALVFMAVRGEANYYMTDEAKACLNGIGLDNYDFKTGELWAFCSYKKKDEGEKISLARGFDAVELEASIKLGYFVNEQVQGNILLPLIDLLLSTPASLAISKVSELELLTILARHDDHKRVMVNSDGLMQYVVELVDNMASKPADYLRLNPLMIAHCIGAMKIVTAISVAQESHEKIAEHGVLDAILRLLYLVNSVELGQLQETSAGTKEEVDIVETVTTSDDDDGVSTNPQGQSFDHVLTTPSENVSAMAKEVHLTASGLRSPVFAAMENNTPVASDQLKGTPLTTGQRKALQSETVSGEVVVHDDLDEAFTSLTGLAVIALYNCLDLITSFEESREHFLQSGAVQILWCRLLTAGASAAQQIGLATETLLNSCCCMTMLEKYYPDILVELDEQTKTPALLLSADRLEVSNPNWTFESVRATFCVGRGISAVPPYPAGWYYEVTLKSSGILQIGWQTEDCRYGPERGVGVGDDTNSCAFDGARCKVWNGPPSEQRNNDYGREWSYGDVLSCLFSWNGELSFWLNGVDMGVAFRGLNPAVNWYPAASIAMDQHCCFNFGGKPFRYDMPDGYIAASQVVNNLFKKLPLRLSSCWTPISGSFESIVEEDEENSQEDLGESEAGRVHTEKTAEKPRPRLSHEKDDFGVSTEKERRHSNLSLRELIDCDASLVSTPTGATNSITFVTPISSLSSSPPGTSPQSIACDFSFTQEHAHPTEPVNETQYEEKPPFEEKPVSSTPYLGEMFLEKSIVKHFEQSRPVTRRGIGGHEESFIDELGPANPWLYFESDLKNAPCRVKQMGFINVETKERIYCDIHDGHLHLPHSSCPAAHEQESSRVPDIVGCAVMLSTGQVVFTLDGVGTGQFYDFPSCKSSSVVVKNLFPYISCSRIRCNYGQRPFLFEGANRKTFTLACGILTSIS